MDDLRMLKKKKSTRKKVRRAVGNSKNCFRHLFTTKNGTGTESGPNILIWIQAQAPELKAGPSLFNSRQMGLNPPVFIPNQGNKILPGLNGFSLEIILN